MLLGSRGVQGSVPALCSAASALKVGAAEHSTGTEMRACLWRGAGQLLGPVECVSGDCISGSIWSREAGDLSGRGVQYWAGSCCFSHHYLLGVTWVAQVP